MARRRRSPRSFRREGEVRRSGVAQFPHRLGERLQHPRSRRDSAGLPARPRTSACATTCSARPTSCCRESARAIVARWVPLRRPCESRSATARRSSRPTGGSARSAGRWPCTASAPRQQPDRDELAGAIPGAASRCRRHDGTRALGELARPPRTRRAGRDRRTPEARYMPSTTNSLPLRACWRATGRAVGCGGFGQERAWRFGGCVAQHCSNRVKRPGNRSALLRSPADLALSS